VIPPLFVSAHEATYLGIASHADFPKEPSPLAGDGDVLTERDRRRAWGWSFGDGFSFLLLGGAGLSSCWCRLCGFFFVLFFGFFFFFYPPPLHVNFSKRSFNSPFPQ